MLTGKTFQRLSDPTAPGVRRMQTWEVVRKLDDVNSVYECKLLDHIQDLMLTANPQTRTFRESEILKHLKTK